MSRTLSKRERTRQRQQQQQNRIRLIIGAVVIGVVGVLALMLYPALRPAEGKAVPIEGRDHVAQDTVPGPYNTNPPTSGSHYDTPAGPGFYEAGDPLTQVDYPAGYLVHSLEHGYIIFWYNCDVIDANQCESLKNEIRAYIEDSAVRKLIAFPWSGTESPLVLTSWGYMKEMDKFNERETTAFINANRFKAPEPNAE